VVGILNAANVIFFLMYVILFLFQVAIWSTPIAHPRTIGKSQLIVIAQNDSNEAYVLKVHSTE
jgi:hypothetical protein